MNTVFKNYQFSSQELNHIKILMRWNLNAVAAQAVAGLDTVGSLPSYPKLSHQNLLLENLDAI